MSLFLPDIGSDEWQLTTYVGEEGLCAGSPRELSCKCNRFSLADQKDHRGREPRGVDAQDMVAVSLGSSGYTRGNGAAP